MRAPGRWRYKDAVFLSPHKFVGGPGTPGRARRPPRAARATGCPTVPGGGTVAYVNPTEHRYLDDPVHREEGGTPAIVESIRAGLVFQLKEAVGTDAIRAREERLHRGAPSTRWAREPEHRDPRQPRAPSGCRSSRFVVRPGGRYLHHNFVVALLNDLFGIQARGGCSCAGPYGHRLLGIDVERSHAVRAGDRRAAARASSRAGCGSTSTTSSPRRCSTTSSTRSTWSPTTAGGCCRDYRFDPHTGLWRHRGGAGRAAAAPARRSATTPTGALRCPAPPRDRRPRSALAGYLDEARAPAGRAAPDPARRRRPRPGCPPTSRSCAGSSCPRSASSRAGR